MIMSVLKEEIWLHRGPSWVLMHRGTSQVHMHRGPSQVRMHRGKASGVASTVTASNCGSGEDSFIRSQLS